MNTKVTYEFTCVFCKTVAHVTPDWPPTHIEQEDAAADAGFQWRKDTGTPSFVCPCCRDFMAQPAKDAM